MARMQEINSSGSLKPGTWSTVEDDTLVSLVEDHLQWGKIASVLNEQIHNGQLVRTGKKCKERWYNHLCPSINRSEWTPEEDLRALEGYKRLGNMWKLITREVGNRTEIGTKNRINSMLNKARQELGNTSQAELIENAINRVKSLQS